MSARRHGYFADWKIVADWPTMTLWQRLFWVVYTALWLAVLAFVGYLAFEAMSYGL